MSNTARDLIWPTDPDVLVRVVILHVGQGASALVLVAEQDTYKTLLVDINLDSKCDGIDVPKLVKDLVGEEGLDVFVNTHPHNDHLCGVAELSEEVEIRDVWHSGHDPGPKHCERYQELKDLIAKVEESGGEVVLLEGSRSSEPIGEAEYHVLSPAHHVAEEIGDESPDVRYERIHEHCAVLKFGTGNDWVMLPGDADYEAWKNHITDYHTKHGTIPATVFAAPHHGSHSFFFGDENEDGDPYLDALESVDPEWVIISAPRSEESQWDHPHEDSLGYYSDQVGTDKVLHTGADRHSFICDVLRSGGVQVYPDEGKLSQDYPYKTDGGNGGGGKKSESISKGTAFRSSAPAILGNDGRSG